MDIPDLDRQIEFLKERFSEGKSFSDTGSDLNYNRRGLQRLLKRVASGIIGKVVVTYNDRLCRYGLELIEWIFKEHSVELVVLCEDISGETEEVAKHNGRKTAQYRKLRKSKRNPSKTKDTDEPQIKGTWKRKMNKETTRRMIRWDLCWVIIIFGPS